MLTYGATKYCLAQEFAPGRGVATRAPGSEGVIRGIFLVTTFVWDVEGAVLNAARSYGLEEASAHLSLAPTPFKMAGCTVLSQSHCVVSRQFNFLPLLYHTTISVLACPLCAVLRVLRGNAVRSFPVYVLRYSTMRLFILLCIKAVVRYSLCNDVHTSATRLYPLVR